MHGSRSAEGDSSDEVLGTHSLWVFLFFVFVFIIIPIVIEGNEGTHTTTEHG